MSIWTWFRGGREKEAFIDLKGTDIKCAELEAAAQEYQLRMLAFMTCANMIANAIARCEFRTFKEGKEVKEVEHYLWNIEPNVNQNSSAFIRKLVFTLLSKNEVLVIETKGKDGRNALVVADTWNCDKTYPTKQNEYTSVVVGETSYNKTFKENEVLHLNLNNEDIKLVLDGVYNSYNAMITAARKNYEWTSGQHWKVHVGQVTSGEDGWEEKVQAMLNNQAKPFMTSKNGVLPEFDGYQYENVGAEAQKTRSEGPTRDIRHLYDDIFDFTARALNIPTVLITGGVADTQDAMSRWLTFCIDPLCDNLQSEINRKVYGFERWKNGDYLQIDTSTLIHFDLFANATNIEKLIGSGFASINDLRRAAGQTEIDEPWANKHWLTKNISTLDGAALEQ